jgi:hypothetical protein
MAGFHLLLAAFALVQIARYGRGAVRFVRSLGPGARGLRPGTALPFTITLVSLLILVTALVSLLRGRGQW